MVCQGRKKGGHKGAPKAKSKDSVGTTDTQVITTKTINTADNTLKWATAVVKKSRGKKK